MHPDSMYLMTNFRNAYHECIRGRKVLDVGSQDINGSYRQMFEELSCEYKGVDIIGGPNVDIIADDLRRLPFDDKSFDIIVSGQMLEHAAYPWLIAKEMGRVLKPGGLVCWIAPWRFHVHRDALCPYDRWRILDDGMRILLEEAGVKVLQCEMFNDDTYGIGEKIEAQEA